MEQAAPADQGVCSLSPRDNRFGPSGSMPGGRPDAIKCWAAMGTAGLAHGASGAGTIPDGGARWGTVGGSKTGFIFSPHNFTPPMMPAALGTIRTLAGRSKSITCALPPPISSVS